MAWYPLPQAGDTVSAGDEFFETQSAGWSLWSFTAPDVRSSTAGVCSLKQEHGVAPPGSTGPSEEEQSAPFEELLLPHPAPDILLGQLFSDEGMRRMDEDDAPLEELGVFPDSMNMLLSLSSYENMLTGLLTGAEEQGDHAEQLDRNGVVDAMGTCGLQNGSRDAARQSSSSNLEMLAAGLSSEEEEQAGLQSMAKRSRAGTGMESTPPEFEALVLEELEDVVFQLARNTRMRFRDAFYRLAESSKPNWSSSSIQQPDGNASSSRFSPVPGCSERETNPIDRTVMVLTLEAPRPQLHGSCCAGEDSGAEVQSATSWAA